MLPSFQNATYVPKHSCRLVDVRFVFQVPVERFLFMFRQQNSETYIPLGTISPLPRAASPQLRATLYFFDFLPLTIDGGRLLLGPQLPATKGRSRVVACAPCKAEHNEVPSLATYVCTMLCTLFNDFCGPLYLEQPRRRRAPDNGDPSFIIDGGVKGASHSQPSTQRYLNPRIF